MDLDKKQSHEIRVDFSDVEEEVAEEIQTTEQVTVDSPFDKLQAALPPQLAEWVDRLKDSYTTHRKYYIIGAVAVIIVLIVIVALGLLLLWGDDGPNFSYSASSQTFVMGPFTLHPGSNSIVRTISKPEGDFSLRKMQLSILDGENNTISQASVYSNYIYILNQDKRMMFAMGAEDRSSAALNLPNPYVVSVSNSDSWILNANLDNLWGIVANADMDVYFSYEVIFSEPDTDSDMEVHWALVGSDFSNRGDRDVRTNEFSYTTTLPFDSSSTIVVASGHLNIGGMNITLQDKSADEQIAFCEAEYDPNTGYIAEIPSVYPQYELNSRTLLVKAIYDEEHEYNDVVNVFQLWGTFPEDFGPFSSQPSSPSPTPSPERSADSSPSQQNSPSPTVSISMVGASPDASPTPTSAVSPSSEASSSPAASPSPSPEASPSPSPAASPTSAVSPSSDPSPSSAASPTPSPTPSPVDSSDVPEEGAEF